MEARYQQLQRELKSQILAGKYPVGGLIPSENELCKHYHVTRTTVRHAMLQLEQEGYIQKRQGKGSLVIAPVRRTLGLLSVKGFSEVLSGEQLEVHTLLLEGPHYKNWDEDFFFLLSPAEKEAGSIYLRRLRCAGNDPAMLEDTYLPNLNLPGFCAKPLVNGSLFETLNKTYHIEITAVNQDLRAVSADDATAGYLNMNPGEPLLHIFLRFQTNRDSLFIYSSLYCNTNRFSIGNKL
jgi:DNA-binding GntR family transcriptional regulator